MATVLAEERVVQQTLRRRAAFLLCLLCFVPPDRNARQHARATRYRDGLARRYRYSLTGRYRYSPLDYVRAGYRYHLVPGQRA